MKRELDSLLLFIISLSYAQTTYCQSTEIIPQDNHFKIRYEFLDSARRKGEKLIFTNDELILRDESFRISENGQLAATKTNGCRDTSVILTIYNTNGISVKRHTLPSDPFVFDVSNNGAFALFGSRLNNCSGENFGDTTNLLLFNPEGNLIYKNSETFSIWWYEAFSQSGEIFVYLTTIYPKGPSKLFIFKDITTTPLYISVEINNWPSGSQMSDIPIIIDDILANEIILTTITYGPRARQYKLDNLFYDLNGNFLKVVEGRKSRFPKHYKEK